MRYPRLLVSALAFLAMALLFSAPRAEGATSPTFNVYVTWNEVHGYEWPLGAEVTLLIDDPDVPGPVDYSDSQTVVEADWDPSQTWVQFVLPETFEIQPGHVVTLTDGATVKTHTVTSLTITAVDPAADTVTGAAGPGARIDVWACNAAGCVPRSAIADAAGDWTADFSAPGPSRTRPSSTSAQAPTSTRTNTTPTATLLRPHGGCPTPTSGFRLSTIGWTATNGPWGRRSPSSSTTLVFRVPWTTPTPEP